MLKTSGEYVTCELVFIDADTCLSAAVAMMNCLRISSLIVTEHGRTVGIFTEMDLLLRVRFENVETGQIAARETGRDLG